MHLSYFSGRVAMVETDVLLQTTCLFSHQKLVARIGTDSRDVKGVSIGMENMHEIPSMSIYLFNIATDNWPFIDDL